MTTTIRLASMPTCGEHETILAIDTLEVLRGRLPRRAMSVVVEWAFEHRKDWRLAESHEPLRPIEPSR